MKDPGERIASFLKGILIGWLFSGIAGYESIIFILNIMNPSHELQNTILITNKGLAPSLIPTQNLLSRCFFVLH